MKDCVKYGFKPVSWFMDIGYFHSDKPTYYCKITVAPISYRKRLCVCLVGVTGYEEY